MKASKPVKVGEARTKEVGTGQVSMRGLIGDRFLKMFFGGLSHRRKDNPAGKAGNALENEAEKPTEAGCTSKEDTPEKKASQEIEKTGEINKFTAQEDGSDRTAGVPINPLL